MSKVKSHILLIACLYAAFASSQQQQADSLLKIIISSYSADTTKVRAYATLCNIYAEPDLEKAIQYGKLGLKLSEKIKFSSGIALSNANLAAACLANSEYREAITYYHHAYEIRKNTGDLFRAGICLKGIGICYESLGEYDEALKYLFEANELFTKINDKENQLNTLVAIITVHYNNRDLITGLKKAEKLLKLSIQSGDSLWVSTACNNMALILTELKRYDDALPYYQRALRIDEKAGYPESLEAEYLNIGLLYHQKKEYHIALDYFMKCRKYSAQVPADEKFSIIYNNIAESYLALEQYTEAITYGEKSLKHAIASQQKDKIKDACANLRRVYKANGNLAKAYEMLEIYAAMQDTLFNEDRQQRAADLQTKYDVFNKEKENLELNQRVQVKELESKSQQIIIYSVSAGGLLLLFLVFVVLRSNREKRVANLKLQAQNKEILKQKDVIEEKNKDLHDSMIYARRIQRVLMASENYIDKKLKNLRGK